MKYNWYIFAVNINKSSITYQYRKTGWQIDSTMIDSSTRGPVYPSTCQPVDLSTFPSVELSTRRPLYPSTCQPSTCQPVYLSTCKTVNKYPIYLFFILYLSQHTFFHPFITKNNNTKNEFASRTTVNMPLLILNYYAKSFWH